MNSRTPDAPLNATRPRGRLSALGASLARNGNRERPPLSDYGLLGRYGLAVGTVAVAMALTQVIAPLRTQPPTIVFFVAVILTSWYSGERAGIFATLLSILVMDVAFVHPVYSFHLQLLLLDNSIDLLAFAVGAWAISSLQERWRRDHRSLVAVEYELEIARRIQQHFLVSRAPTVGGLEIAGACIPASATGGDFFDYIPMANGRLGIVVGDVSGHGVGPALVMARVQAYLRALALTHDDPKDILTLANRLVYQDTEDDCFVTVFFAQFDPRTHMLRYAAAGHEAYLVGACGEKTALKSTGLPLAVEADAEDLCSATLPIQPGQIVLLVSDGITEAMSADGEQFGVARAIETVVNHHQHPAKEIVAALYRAASGFRGKAVQQDDMTIVVLKARCAAG